MTCSTTSIRPVVIRAFLILGVIVPASIGAAADNHTAPSTYNSVAFGKQYTIHVTRDVLARTPEWPNEAENPPLSARRALALAEEQANKLIGKKPGFHRTIGGGLCLVQSQDRWMWVTRFEWDAEGNSTGIPDHLVVVVLMDGKAVEPVVRDWPPNPKRQ